MLEAVVSGGQRNRSIFLVGALGIALITLAVALNVGWVVANWRSGLLLFFGVLCFMLLIAGVSLNTVFLIREIRRNEQHDAFINAVTHELKTPLASIRLFLQTLQQRDLDRAKQQEFIDVMLADSERLQSTIDQVLLAGKTGSAARPIAFSDVDLGEIVRECLTLAGRRHHLGADQLELIDNLGVDSGAMVSGDLDELKAAISNLVDNAIKYSGDSVHVAVEIARAGARKVAIHVRDQGIGITNEELKRVFRRFYRIPPATPARRVAGTGLGLSIVRSVAKRHGGRAYVESEGAGKGSTFTLELPLKAA
ncbi:MAG: sensor histidine kinase [Acidobacteria bacterium]|nr:sensor histidine kinase [Acidobacteriota bacterium]